MYGTGDYYRWLIDICGKRFDGKLYLNLLTRLWSTDFYAVIPMDENRIEEALKLRYEFAHSVGMNEDDADAWISENLLDECNLLEILINLASRCAFLIGTSTDDGSKVEHIWFWRMIANLGLTKYDDDHWSSRSVDEAIYILLDRKYAPNGEGGLFPIFGSERDERKVELLYQMYKYLLTYYDDEIQ